MASQRGTRVGAALWAIALPAALLVVAIVAGVVLWGHGDLNGLICDGDCGPSNVVPPAGLAPAATPSVATPAAPSAGPVDPQLLSNAVDGLLGAGVLGPNVGFAAIDAGAGTELASSGADGFVPASTTKVLTGFAALATIDPQTRFTTRVVRGSTDAQQSASLVLVGGGDPYLAVDRAKGDDRVVRADLTTLARRTAAALTSSGATSVTLAYDDSLFTGPDASPGWESSYVSQNIVTPVSALWADQGVTSGIRARQPAEAAAKTFAALLERRGITVSDAPTAGTAPESAETVAAVRSAPLAQIVETLIRISDNQAAEVVLRHVAIAAGEPATFDGGTAAVRDALTTADVDTAGLSLNDGSGLSRRNRISPDTLVQTLRAAAESPQASGLLAALPVSGFTGTLVGRFSQLTAARGTVRAKTGTLTGVHSLAGYAVDAEGRPVLFAVMADRTDKNQPFAAQAALDRVAAAIASCRCG
ncbi:MAG: dacB [Aeromicrobium sp.]|nr:dacB [Aeromicrobium sp.]